MEIGRRKRIRDEEDEDDRQWKTAANNEPSHLMNHRCHNNNRNNVDIAADDGCCSEKELGNNTSVFDFPWSKESSGGVINVFEPGDCCLELELELETAFSSPSHNNHRLHGDGDGDGDGDGQGNGNDSKDRDHDDLPIGASPSASDLKFRHSQQDNLFISKLDQDSIHRDNGNCSNGDDSMKAYESMILSSLEIDQFQLEGSDWINLELTTTTTTTTTTTKNSALAAAAAGAADN